MGPRYRRIQRPVRSVRRRRLVVERLDQRRVLATITGTVFDDANHSFGRDDGEAGLPSRVVYLDSNHDGALDPAEPIALTGPTGEFTFSSLSDGQFVVRLFNGTSSQSQTFPIKAETAATPLAVSDATQLVVLGAEPIAALKSDGVVLGDLTTGATESIPVGSQLTRMQPLPDGRLLVIGTDVGGATAWIVDPATAAAESINLADSDPPTLWSTVAVDGSGRGVAIADGSGKLFAIDATGPTITAIDTLQNVAADSQVLASTTGVRTAVAAPDDTGLQVRFWSNDTSSFITDAIPLPGATELLAFDDTAGVLAVRNDAGGVNLYDGDNIPDPPGGLPTLHVFNELQGPVAIDGTRDLLFAVSPLDAMLKIIHIQTGDVLAELAVDAAEIGSIAEVAVGDRDDALVILGAAGITELALRKPAAHEIEVTAGQAPPPLSFGVSLRGENLPPEYASQPAFTVAEDSSLQLHAPAALLGATDPDGDAFVLIQTADAFHGTATIRTAGAVDYQPTPDFFGLDAIAVRLHDGRDASAEYLLQVQVTPVADPPEQLIVSIHPVPENLPVGAPLGTIEVVDVDGQPLPVTINDPRFGHVEGQLIYLGGGLDYETQPLIPLTITVTDAEAGASIEEHVALSISDANDPVTEITLSALFVDENSPGAAVGELTVFDQDAEQVHFLTVDDPRFEVDENVLKLRAAEQLDHETEPTVVIHVTAQEIPGGGTYSQQFTIAVNDVPEQPQLMGLTNDSVVEFEPGAIVGEITLDQAAAVGNYEFIVDDPRFEFDGATLKLRDSEYVVRFQQQEIQLEVTGEDTSGQFSALQETFLIEVVVNELPYHNHENPYDVNGDGEASAEDALVIINWMGTYGPGPVGSGNPGYGYDVNGDGQITALDALLIINELNRIHSAGGTVGGGQGEGEQPDSPADNGRRLTQAAPARLRLSSPALDPQPNIPAESGGAVPLAPSRSTLKLVDVSLTDRTSDQLDEIEIPDVNSGEKFAQHVDHTLRLLADRDG